MKLGLTYNVQVKTIKQVNGLASDQIFQLREILIPVTSFTKLDVPMAQKTEEQILADKMKNEEWRRESAVHQMNLYMKSRMPNRKIAQSEENYRAEAIFYCEQVNFEFAKAKALFDADLQFE